MKSNESPKAMDYQQKGQTQNTVFGTKTKSGCQIKTNHITITWRAKM